MSIRFSDFFNRLRQSTDIRSQMDLARALCVDRSAITQAKKRDTVPGKWILSLSRRFDLSPDWLEFGTGSARFVGGHSSLPTAMTLVPKVSATLCAGAGSLDVEAAVVASHPFPEAWLARMGSPSAMVFMDVIGNSMEPGIRDGDMVLVDQANTDFSRRAVMAVGFEDAIFIKRILPMAGGFSLVSDNPDHAPIPVRGDETNSFRVLGRVIWMCRDCRYE